MITMSNDRVVELLNAATLATDTTAKLESLRIVQELLIRKEPELLDNFLDEVSGFQKDRSQEVRKFVVGFIEEGCRKDPELLPKVIANLRMLMTDSAVAVQKRVIQAMTHLHKVTLAWISKAKHVTADMEAVWGVVKSIKDIIVHLLDAENDGIRTHTVKFMESLVICQTHRETDSMPSKSDDFNLDDVPLTLKIVRRRKLEIEAGQVFEELINYHESAHISSANLMTCMGALTNIAKCRPQFMAKVITALEMLQANLPPTLAKSQVSSVRKHLKNQLLALLRHPIASDPEQKFFTNITTLLTDLGASRDEVMKAMPKFEEMKKRVRKVAEMAAGSSSGASAAKKAKLDLPSDVEEDDSDDDDDDDEEEEEDAKVKKKNFSESQIEGAVDITEKFIIERLTSSVAAEIVMQSMAMLPRNIPPQFHSTYTPIAAAGTEGQVKHVSRLLATQLTSAKLGPGMEAMRKAAGDSRRAELADEETEVPTGKISTVINQSTISTSGSDVNKAAKAKVTLQPAGMTSGLKKPRSKAMRLADFTFPLSDDERQSALEGAFRRVLNSTRYLPKNSSIQEARNKVLTSMATHFPSHLKPIFLTFLLDDIKSRSSLAISWLYEEYCFYMGFNRVAAMMSMGNKRNDDDPKEYNIILCSMIKGVMAHNDRRERDQLLHRLYLEVPIITDDAIDLLKQFIQFDEASAISVVVLMRDVVLRRPSRKMFFLYPLLEVCYHELTTVRDNAIEVVLNLYVSGDLNENIEEYSVMYLKFLLDPSPPSMLFGEHRGRPMAVNVWDENIIKICLYLYLNLLPLNLSLFKHLAKVYINTTGDIKRTILRVLDTTVRNIDMNNPDLLTLIENCPKGAETLVTRIIHILTDKSQPTPALVDKVRDLYEKRVSDVRFLIPVLSGLSKQEILNALPKFISLNVTIVKEVFNRLTSNPNSSVSPADLLIALHNIDASKCDMKTVIKATTICFQDKSVFTKEVLAIVLQQLLEQPSIPLLFMRTVIQVLQLHPSLIGFVMNNILQRLIVKQVWKEPKAWDGFIRCCERTVPQSYAVILQLPPAQLQLLLESATNIREPLLEHVESFTEAQRAHVSANIMAVLYDADVKKIRQREVGGEMPSEFDDSVNRQNTPPPGE